MRGLVVGFHHSTAGCSRRIGTGWSAGVRSGAAAPVLLLSPAPATALRSPMAMLALPALPWRLIQRVNASTSTADLWAWTLSSAKFKNVVACQNERRGRNGCDLRLFGMQ
jgi:hypothetical protein